RKTTRFQHAPSVRRRVFFSFCLQTFMRIVRTTKKNKSRPRMKFCACGPSPAHALKFHAVPPEAAQGNFAMPLHSKKKGEQMAHRIFTSESVTEGHPDKAC